LAGGRKNSDGTPERVILRVPRVAQGVFVAGAVVLLAATMTDGRVLPSAGAMLRTIMVVAAVAAASSLVALKVLSARQLRDLPCAPDPPLAGRRGVVWGRPGAADGPALHGRARRPRRPSRTR